MIDGLFGKHTPAAATSRSPLAVVVIVAALQATVAAQDTVYVSSSNVQGYTKFTGRVVDYTGRELLLEMPGGTRRSLKPERILRIDTYRGQDHVSADSLFAEGEFGSALPLYEKARNEETRSWVRREITAQMVWCYQAWGRWDLAGEQFLLLVRSDPNTPYFASIPLAWVASPPSAAVERAAGTWIKQDEMPAAVLMGASYLMSTALRAEALARLRQLATSTNPTIGQLALAQTWRAEAVTADTGQLAAWEGIIERMPEPLRAGPYYVLGRGWAQRQAWEEAALAWMRIPVLYAEHRHVAAWSLLDAGRALEELDRPKQATRLYHELIENFPEVPAAAEAKSRIGNDD